MGIFKDLMDECAVVAGTAQPSRYGRGREPKMGFVSSFARSFVSGFYAPRNIQRAQAGDLGHRSRETRGQRRGPSDPGPDFG